jgi:hypothetical protein
MKLLPAPEYAIRVIVPSTSETAPESEIMIDAVPAGKIIGGAVLEAALKWNDYVLLFLTDDVPFEEGLNIYLLDAKLNVLDSAQIGWMYSTGIFSNLDLTASNIVRFRFFAEQVWTLKLLPEKEFALPIISDPLAVSRPFKFFRMFQLHSSPLTRTLNQA